MVHLTLLTTGSLALSLLSSTTRAQYTGNVPMLLLGKLVPTVIISGDVRQVLATKTVYYVNCDLYIGDEGDEFGDPCPLIGGTVTQEASTRWEYDIKKKTEQVAGTGTGIFTVETIRSTTGNIVCAVTSNTGDCTGSLTTYHTTRGSTNSGSTVISTRISDVAASLETVAITSGMEKLQKTTTTTSSSTGAAAPALVTQPARLLVGAAVMVGGALIA